MIQNKNLHINYNIHNYVYGVRLSLLGDFNDLIPKNQLK